MTGKRKHPDVEKELEKVDIIWQDPFGYIFKSSDDGEWAKMCKVEEVETQVGIIVDNKLRSFGVNP